MASSFPTEVSKMKDQIKDYMKDRNKENNDEEAGMNTLFAKPGYIISLKIGRASCRERV